MSTLVLLSVVDVVNGQAVRLTQEQAGTETVYDTPSEAARSFAETGAKWPYLVDLDVAFGHGSDVELL